MREDLEMTIRSLRKENRRLESLLNTKDYYVFRLARPGSWRLDSVRRFGLRVRAFLRTVREIVWPDAAVSDI